MSQVYVGQTDLLIRCRVNKNITGAMITRIAYRDPTGVEGFFNATVENALTGVLVFPAINNELNVGNTWRFWADVTLSNGLRAIGKPFDYRVVYPGQL